MSQQDAENGWLRAVLTDETDWACCEACERNVETYLAKSNEAQSPEAERSAEEHQSDAATDLVTAYQEARRLQACGQLDESIVNYENALVMARELFAEDLITARIMNNAALVCMECGRNTELERFSRTVGRSPRTYRDKTTSTWPVCWTILGNFCS